MLSTISEKNIHNRPLFCKADIDSEGKMWFWETNHNSLFSWDMQNPIISKHKLSCYMGDMIEKREYLYYTQLFVHNNKVILIPRSGSNLLIYDIATKKVTEINLPYEMTALIENGECLFSAYEIYGDYLYLVGGFIPYIVKFCLNTDSFEGYINLYPTETIRTDYLYFRDIRCVNDKIVICCAEKNDIFIVNPIDLSFEKTEVKGITRGFSSMVIVDNKIYFIPRYSDPIFVWNLVNNKWKKISEYPYEFSFNNDEQRQLDFPIYFNDKIYIFPIYASDVLILNLNTDELSVEQIINKQLKSAVEQLSSDGVICCAVKKYKNELFILCGRNRRILIYNLADDSVEWKDIAFSDDENLNHARRKLNIQIKENGIAVEDGEMYLKCFIQAIVKDEYKESY